MDTILETRHGDIKLLKYNKPGRKNAIDLNMYIRITKILKEATEDSTISMVVLTGVGDYFTSGNDFVAAADSVSAGRHDVRANVFKGYIEALINFPKLLVAIVNGPAIGIGATQLALCDLVFASENSYFYTPFSKLGIVAECGSTYTFPRIIGDRKAAEMLLFNHRMSAKEALECGFVNYIYKEDELETKAWEKIEEISKFSQHSILVSRKLMRRNVQDEIIKANEAEIEELEKVWTTDEYLSMIQNFVNKKSKV